MNINVIIPIFNLTDHRLRNFNFISEQICDAGLKLTVVEQQSSNMVELPKYINHIIIPSSSPVITKSLLINYGVKSCPSKMAWIHDADIYLPFKDIFNSIDLSCKAIKPFIYFMKLDENNTELFVKNEKINMKVNMWGFEFGSGSFIIDKAFFNNIGMMNEKFIGWGWEDIEFGFRVGKYTNINIMQYKALHLYHDTLNGVDKNRERFNASILRDTINRLVKQ